MVLLLVVLVLVVAVGVVVVLLVMLVVVCRCGWRLRNHGGVRGVLRWRLLLQRRGRARCTLRANVIHHGARSRMRRMGAEWTRVATGGWSLYRRRRSGAGGRSTVGRERRREGA
jgi:hypothetical protein